MWVDSKWTDGLVYRYILMTREGTDMADSVLRLKRLSMQMRLNRTESKRMAKWRVETKSNVKRRMEAKRQVKSKQRHRLQSSSTTGSCYGLDKWAR